MRFLETRCMEEPNTEHDARSDIVVKLQQSMERMEQGRSQSAYHLGDGHDLIERQWACCREKRKQGCGAEVDAAAEGDDGIGLLLGGLQLGLLVLSLLGGLQLGLLVLSLLSGLQLGLLLLMSLLLLVLPFERLDDRTVHQKPQKHEHDGKETHWQEEERRKERPHSPTQPTYLNIRINNGVYLAGTKGRAKGGSC
jgi:hypothetical protein